MSGTTDTMTCNSMQHGVMITQPAGFSAVTSGRLPSFSTVTSTTWSLPAMSIREPWSMVAEPSVSWRGQGLPVFSGLGQRMTSGQTNRGNYLNVTDSVNVGAQSLPVTSSNQGTVASSPFNLGVLTNQIPPLPKFSGEVDSSKGDSESFTDWKEKFEMVAEAYHWDDRTKLVRLRGQAYSFYRSCDGNQRSCYANLFEQLVRRFTPVRIGAVQSSLFHDRCQGEKESVDDYAQELRKLFYKAYPQAMQGATDLEDISKSILCNQFVAGLLSSIKIKVAGTEGNFGTLLTKARFEEAKLRELGKSEPVSSKRQNLRLNTGVGRRFPSNSSSSSNSLTNTHCYKCGSLGHTASNCPLKGRQSRESQRPH